MSRSEITRQRALRRVGGRVARAGTLVWALVAIAFVPAASAFTPPNVFWTNNGSNTIGHANFDVNQSFVGLASASAEAQYVAVDAQHVYWTSFYTNSIGESNLDGTQVKQSFITGAKGPLGVAVDAQHIYWVNERDGTIGRANLDGTGVNQAFMTVGGLPFAIAVDGQHIYWTDNGAGTIGEANLDGTIVNPSLISGANRPVAMAIDKQSIYWTNYGANTLGQANLDGTAVNPNFVTGANGPNGIVVDGQNVYWTNNGNGTIGQASLGIRWINQSFITGVNDPQGLARDARHLYWANVGARSIGRADVSQSLISGANQPLGVAVGAKHLYWANANANTIGRSNLDGTGVSQSFIKGAHAPTGVAIDAQHIYWTNSSDNTIGEANLDGTGVNQKLIQNASSPEGVAVDAHHIYWSNYNTNTIGEANLDGTGVNPSVVQNASGPWGVAVDGQHIYWANRLSNAIGEANLDGTSANQTFIVSPDGNLVNGPDNPFGVAVDRQHVYWTNLSPGTIGEANLDGTIANLNLITGANEPAGVAVWPITHTFYVAPGGSGTDCAANSQSQPFATIQAALSCAQDGDVITLAPTGSTPYPGIGTVSHNVTIQAGPGGTARSVHVDLSQPNNSGGPMTVAQNASVTVQGVTLDCASHQCASANVTNDGSLTLRQVTVTGAGYAAGINDVASGPSSGILTVLSSTVADNTDNGQAGDGSNAGGISAESNNATAVPIVTVVNSTIADNTLAANVGAGGVYTTSSSNGSMTLINDTITGNSGGGPGGLGTLVAAGGAQTPVTASNTLIASNTSGGPSPDCAGNIVDGSGGHNLIGNYSGCSGMTDGVNGDQIGVTQPGIDHTLADNGGSSSTVAVLSGSPAIGHGDASTCGSIAVGGRDERGSFRLATTRGTCDVGAYDTGGKAPGSPHRLIVDAVRFDGPAGSADDYVELYNPSATAVDAGGWRLTYPTGQGTASVAVPEGMVPPRGHFLIAGSQYSLASYVSPDLAPAGLDVPDTGGVALLAPDQTVTDAVGPATAQPPYVEGTGLPTPSQSSSQLGFVRRSASGVPVDTNNNAADFQLVATDADSNDHGAGAVLGAPGPMDLAAPLQHNDIARSTLLDPTSPAGSVPNRVYDPATKTLTLRRTITNTSKTRTITTLRLRITGITTYGTATATQGILTVQSSTTETVGGKTVEGLTLDQPPAQPGGGGLDSSLTVPLPSAGLAPGQSVNVDLVFHQVRTGPVSYSYNAEASTG